MSRGSLASSDSELSSKQVVNLYAKRMQIEQNFRDDKSQRYGFSWRFSKSLGVSRMSVLCLIACIATIALWFIGFEGERRNLHYQFQANSLKKRRVLSFIFLAKLILNNYHRKVTLSYIRKSKQYLIFSYDSLMLELRE
jgi:Transposase DDE domain